MMPERKHERKRERKYDRAMYGVIAAAYFVTRLLCVARGSRQRLKIISPAIYKTVAGIILDLVAVQLRGDQPVRFGASIIN